MGTTTVLGAVLGVAAVALGAVILLGVGAEVADERRTTRRVRALARERGWTWRRADAAATTGFDYPPFDRVGAGTPRRVVRGRHGEHELLAFTIDLPDDGDGTLPFGVLALRLPGDRAPLRVVPPGADLERWGRASGHGPLLHFPAAVEGWSILAPRQSHAGAVRPAAVSLLAEHPRLVAGVDGGMVVLVSEHDPALALGVDDLAPLLEELTPLLGDAQG